MGLAQAESAIDGTSLSSFNIIFTESFTESVCLSVRLSVPLGAVFLGLLLRSHDHSSRPLIGTPSSPLPTAPPPIFFKNALRYFFLFNSPPKLFL